MARPIVVITGASSGIGRAAAHAFARAGYDLALIARRAEPLAEAARECEAYGARAIHIPGDVSDPAAVHALAEATLREFGSFDVWVNCAGVLHFGPLEQTPPDILRRVLDVNVAGAMYGAQEALIHFKRRQRGVLINVSSVLGVVGQPFAASYVASKFAVRGLSEALRQEVQDFPDIQVCSVLPAAIDTPAYQRAANYMGHPMQPIWFLYPPEVAARTIVSLAKRPRRQAIAGQAFGLATLTGKTIAPGLVERVTGRAVRVMEIGRGRAPSTPGAVRDPVEDGLRISGGWRRRYGRKAGRIAAGALLVVAASAGLRLAFPRRA